MKSPRSNYSSTNLAASRRGNGRRERALWRFKQKSPSNQSQTTPGRAHIKPHTVAVIGSRT